MDPSSSDDECIAVQLDGSDMAPKAFKTPLRQRFTMRRYNLEHDGRLTGLAKVMERPFDDPTPTTTTLGPITADMITESIMAILQPHTSSPSLQIIARAMSSLIANFDDEDLHRFLNAQLDTLAISSLAKQAIIPALFGIAKLSEVQSRGIPMSQSGTQTVPDSDAVGPPQGSALPYQMRQRSFTSTSGSGYTVWYFAKSDNNIPSPPTIPQAKTGHLYVHLNSSTNFYHYWMMGTDNQWESVSKGAQYPLNHDRVLAIRGNGEPSWVTRATTTTTQTRKERSQREKSLNPS